MINPGRTLALIKGAIFDAEATWHRYLPEAGDWQKTAFLLTGPLIVLSAVLAYVLGWFGDDMTVFGRFRPTLLSTLLGIVTGAIAAGVVACIFSAVAGAFGGKNSFAHGLAAISLAFVPGYIGQAIAPLPWIGGLLAFGLFIYALVLLWRIIPIYLEVPAGKRVGHYIISLLATIVVMFVISMLLRPLIAPDISGMRDFGSVASTTDASGDFGGVVGTAMRRGELLAAAEDDRYEPPADGELEEGQVEAFIRVMQRASEMQEDKAVRMREIAERAEKNEQMSFSDMSEMMSGATQVAGLNTVELEVVKSGNGNWAEHKWVRQSLRTAWMQKDLNEAIEHNYALYQEYEDELRPFIAR